MTEDEIILVDVNDNVVGYEFKTPAHEKALLHRAFSVFLFNNSGDNLEVLLQQRAKSKYHCPGMWTNTCCSHPRRGEETHDAAIRRLDDELRLTAEVTEVGSFVYRADFDNGLTEHEFDHVFVGFMDKVAIDHNPEEIEQTKWVLVDDLVKDLKSNPDKYTPWFKPALDIALKGINK